MTNLKDIEIRILPQQDQGYPVEITVDHKQQFGGGYLKPADILPWTSSADPVADGQRLFAALFADDALKDGRAQLRHQDCRLRLRLDATSPELHALPWELLRDGSRTLAAQGDTPFSRYIAGQWAPTEPVSDQVIRMVVVLASPANLEEYQLAPLNMEEEYAAIQQGISSFPLLDVTYLPPRAEAKQPVTRAALQTELMKGYHIVHFVAHGMFHKRRQEAVLFLADADNQVDLVRETELADMVQNLDQKPHLIFFSACETASRSPADAFRGLAPQLIQAGVPVVMAMQDLMPVTAAREFTKIFYHQLATAGQVDLAGNTARAGLLAAKLPGGSIPVLFSRLIDNQLLSGTREPLAWFEPSTVHIPAGGCWLGNQPGQDVPPEETPQHQIELPAYRIGQYPVTNKEYAEFVRQTGYEPPKIGSRRTVWSGSFGKKPSETELDHPVIGVSWSDVLAYCDWLTQITGRLYRLPTEAEWEKAARGLDQRLYPWGDEWDASRCHCRPAGGSTNRRSRERSSRRSPSSGPETKPVTAHPDGRSYFGCLDMVGNVWEWTSTLGKSYPDGKPLTYPYRPDDGREELRPESQNDAYPRIVRGGSYNALAYLRCTARFECPPTTKAKDIGFRVVLALED